ncbi:hypothetical protein D3C76_1351080 [compost metagenome]
MGIEFHLREDLRVQADFLAVEQGHLATNDALLFHPLNPPPARRLREPHLLGDLCAGKRSVLLQQGEDLAVVAVQFALHKKTLNRVTTELIDSSFP